MDSRVFHIAKILINLLSASISFNYQYDIQIIININNYKSGVFLQKKCEFALMD